MKNVKKLLIILLFISTSQYFSCSQAGKNRSGSEYMPDMGHSIAFEANYYNYYDLHQWSTEDEYYKFTQPNNKVKGTVPRGYSGGNLDRTLINQHNQTIPYDYASTKETYNYGDNDEERARAINTIIKSPIKITKKGLDNGKLLYDIYCSICHGEKGDGNGYLVRDDGGKYPVQPANLIGDDLISSSNGRYYHAIVYGKNLMGSHGDKLSELERWEVIHYIRSLQATSKNLKYSEDLNELNTNEIPINMVEKLVPKSIKTDVVEAVNKN